MTPNRLFAVSVLLVGTIFLFSCKKKDDPAPSLASSTTPSATEYLTGNGAIKYWQVVSLVENNAYGGVNLYLTMNACAVDNYITFFSDGDYEERTFGSKCFADERLVANSNKWSIDGNTLKVGPFNGGSIYEVSSTLFATDVTIKELNATRMKGFRVKSPGDTIRFTLTAVPM